MSATRTEKLDLRLSANAKQRLRAAAAARGRSLSDFVLDSALAEADEALADRRQFFVDAAHWRTFLEALDAPSRDLPRLRRLMTEPGAFDGGPPPKKRRA